MIAVSQSGLTQPSQFTTNEPFYSLTASRDIATVQRMIYQKYAFVAPANYCADLIEFVHALTDGQ